MAKTNGSRDLDPSIRMELEGSPEVQHVTLRDRLATPIAIIFTSIHALSCLLTAGWFYYFVPRMKKIFDDFGAVLSDEVIAVIRVSDLFVNYWYAAAFFGLFGLVLDIVAIRWITKELGVIAGITFGVCVTAIALGNFAYSYHLLQGAIQNIPLG